MMDERPVTKGPETTREMVDMLAKMSFEARQRTMVIKEFVGGQRKEPVGDPKPTPIPDSLNGMIMEAVGILREALINIDEASSLLGIQ